MKYRVAFLVAFLIICGIYFAFNQRDVLSLTNSTNKLESNSLRKNKTHKINKNDAVDEYILKVEEVRKIDLSSDVLNIKSDLDKLPPCEFLEKYETTKEIDLYLALTGVDAYNEPLSLLYLDTFAPDLLEAHLDNLPNEISLFILDRNIESILTYPNDVLDENDNLNKEREVQYRKVLEYLMYRNEGIVSNLFDKLDGAFEDIDSNPLLTFMLISKASLKYRNLDEKAISELADSNIIKLKLYNVLENRFEALHHNSLDKLDMKENFDKTKSLLALNAREAFLSRAKNPTEVALLNNLYQRKMKGIYSAFTKNALSLKIERPNTLKNIKQNLNDYLNYISQSKNADLISNDLYKVLHIFTDKEMRPYDEFVEGMSGLFDPIYGKGCDDRRFKDVCTKFCSN